MKQEEKELLLRDLCSRLPYGVKASYYGAKEERYTWDEIEGIQILGYVDIGQYDLPIEAIKPYLFPLSSITEKQKKDLLIHVLGKKDCKHFQVLSDGSIGSTDAKQQKLECFNFSWVNFDNETTSAYIDWCNKNHIDYRNLIGKNLALDATGLNIY